jgi:hypothetical protein
MAKNRTRQPRFTLRTRSGPITFYIAARHNSDRLPLAVRSPNLTERICWKCYATVAALQHPISIGVSGCLWMLSKSGDYSRIGDNYYPITLTVCDFASSCRKMSLEADRNKSRNSAPSISISRFVPYRKNRVLFLVALCNPSGSSFPPIKSQLVWQTHTLCAIYVTAVVNCVVKPEFK